jgi:hypothetical protein
MRAANNERSKITTPLHRDLSSSRAGPVLVPISRRYRYHARETAVEVVLTWHGR